MKVLFKKIIMFLIVMVITFSFPIISHADENYTGNDDSNIMILELDPTDPDPIDPDPGDPADSDTTRPTIIGTGLGSQNEYYKKGDVIIVNIQFDEPVICEKEMQVFEIQTNDISVPLVYKEGSGTDTLKYQYTVDEGLDYKGSIRLCSIDICLLDSIRDLAGNGCEQDLYITLGEVNIDSQKPIINEMKVNGGDFPSDNYAKEYIVHINFSERNYQNPTAEVRYYWSTDSNPLLNKSDYRVTHEFLVENISNHNIFIPSNKLGNVEGIFYLHVWIEDDAGNVTTGIFKGNDNNTNPGAFIDAKPPVITFEPIENTPQKEQTVTINITDQGAGVKGYKYALIDVEGNRYPGKANDEYFILDTAEADFSRPIIFKNIIPDILDGKYQLEVSAYDEMSLPWDNNSFDRNYQNEVKSILYTVDTTGPVITFAQKLNNDTITGFDVTPEDKLSNKITLYYSWESNYSVDHTTIQWKPYQSQVSNKEKIVLSPEPELNTGAYYLFIKAVDEAGNESISNSIESVYIPEKPQGTIAIVTPPGSEKGYTKERKVDMNFTVSGEKAPLSMRVKIHKGNWLVWEEVTSDSFSKKIDLTEEEGIQTISVQYKFDYNGKEYISAIYSDSIIYDKTPPDGKVDYSTESTTKEPVTAYLTVTDNINSEGQIKCDPISKQIKFDENGEGTFTFTDLAGNKGTLTVKVDWIINEAPKGTITYSTEEMTRDNVTATLTFPGYNGTITILNNEENNYSNSYTFTENDSFTFKYKNEKDKIGYATATVNNIDKTKPEVKVSYSKTEMTNHNVWVTFTPNETVNMVIEDLASNELKRIDEVKKNKPAEYTFEDNGIIRVKIKDLAGNEITTVKSKDLDDNEIILDEIKVDNIDKTPPIPSLTYTISTNSNLNYDEVVKTKENVAATVSADEDFIVMNNNRQTSKIFTENGEFTFYIKDLAGNTAEITTTVNKIDKSKPKLTLEYSTEEVTKDNVIVTLKSDREIDILNNNESNTLEFTQNGMNWFKVKDKLGNIVYKKVYITNIDRIKPEIKFQSNEALLLDINEIFDPMEGVTIMDNEDGDITNKVHVTGNVDISKKGKYVINYSVSDKAENKLSYDRIVEVLTDEELTIYVDSEWLSDTHTNVIRRKDFAFNVYGIQGDYKFWWDYGKHEIGYFKRPKQKLSSFDFTAEKPGWYTFYILDQERKHRLLKIFLIY